MSYIQWSNAYSVNIQKIDQQHQQLVSYINELHEAMSQGKSKQVLGEILGKLTKYTVEHFGLEEELMQEHHFPDFQLHKLAHKDFINKVSQAQKDFESGKFLISVDVLNYLKDWLISHIMGVDQNYAQFFKEKGIK